MDPADLFRQAQSSVSRSREAKSFHARESSHDSEDHSPRIAHTLTACCRCRQRKTRCDPNLPKCLPCERAGAICEYFDTTKGKKISRTYVIRLQDKVRALEKELSQYTEEDFPPETEDIVRPGGLVRLDEDDETPRFLGPSSGIAMTRIVMEEAKKYSDSRNIRELVPEVRDRRTPVQSPGSTASTGRKKSYPMISAVPALTLPSRLVTDKLVEIFNQKAQYLTPTLHEPSFAKDMQDVYDGDSDPYKNFVVRIVLAIAMQKLDPQYAGLADSYYLASMAYLEEVVRPKDLKTLQCLVLIAQYSLLTPTRTAIYYVVGLATRLCQQLGLAEEKTITQGVSLGLVNPIQMDMRRRLSWIVLQMEFGLAHSMGRPNGTGQDTIDVGFFEPIDDEYITAEGILPGPVSEKKTVAIHFLRMRCLQAEIRRVLYQKKRPEPTSENHPWYAKIEKDLQDWVDSSPPTPVWSKPWFVGRYKTMVVMLLRPSPQVPKPSANAAIRCYDASSTNIKSLSRQMDTALVDITWIFVLTLFQAINTILWSISYQEVRDKHTKEELEENIEIALEIIVKCKERWPGTKAAHQLYSKLARACLRAFDVRESSQPPSSLSANSPQSLTDANSPSASEHSAASSMAYSQQAPPHFGYVFDQMPEPVQHIDQPRQPSFRSNSIFGGPSIQTDRRFSYFPPEFNHNPNLPNNWNPILAESQPPVSIAQAPQLPQPAIADPTYFMQPTPYSFGSHMYADQNLDTEMRLGSLSQQQQVELMQSLETDGLIEIDNYMTMSAG